MPSASNSSTGGAAVQHFVAGGFCVRALLVVEQGRRAVDDPDVVVAIGGDAGDLAEDPVAGQRLRPERLGPERRGVLGCSGYGRGDESEKDQDRSHGFLQGSPSSGCGPSAHPSRYPGPRTRVSATAKGSSCCILSRHQQRSQFSRRNARSRSRPKSVPRSTHRRVSAFGAAPRRPYSPHGCSGSWLCKNVLAAALTPRDFDRVAVPGHFSGFVGSFRLEVFLMRIPAVLYGSATADGRMSATTMPSSPPGAVGYP